MTSSAQQSSPQPPVSGRNTAVDFASRHFCLPWGRSRRASQACCAAAELLSLPRHGLTDEQHSDAALRPVLRWLEQHTGQTGEAADWADAAAFREKHEERTVQELYGTCPENASTRIDRQYHVEKHLPLVLKSWRKYGLSTVAAFFPEGSGEGTIAICVCTFRNEEGVRASFTAPEAREVMVDIRAFTDAKPSQSLGSAL